jgi:hypothetical protein
VRKSNQCGAKDSDLVICNIYNSRQYQKAKYQL